MPKIDKIIEKAAPQWPLDQIAVVDRNVLRVGLYELLFGNREETYARVNQRARQMVEDGLIEEVRELYEAGLNETNCNALRTHGYQEVFPYLRGEIDRDSMIENIQKAVRHYVKRQLTWFRGVPETIWIERSFADPPEVAAKQIAHDFLSI